MGWDIDRFPEGEVNLDLICCICTNILEDPVESPCRHVFCSLCIKTWLSNQKTCPHCRSPVHKKDLQPVVPLLRSIISKQKIYCDNKEKGCNEVVALESLQGHVAICSYGTISCTNDGCTFKILRKDLKSHTEVCSKKTIMCDQGCEMFLTLGEKGTHNCVQALRRHFTEVTNEILDKVSKLEELVNVLVSKNNPSISQQRSTSNTQRAQHNPPAICQWVPPYTIPSPIPPPSYAVYPEEDFARGGEIENHEFSDSDESVYSSRLTSYPLEQLDAEGNESPMERNNMSPAYPGPFNSDHEERPRMQRTHRNRIRGTMSPAYHNSDHEERPRMHHRQRNRSRSPRSMPRRSHIVQHRAPSSPDSSRRRNRRVNNHVENSERVARQNPTSGSVQGGESVVVSIGVSSETVSSESSSSGSSSASDTE